MARIKAPLAGRAKQRQRDAIAKDLAEKRALDRFYRAKPMPKNKVPKLLRHFAGTVKFNMGWPMHRDISQYETLLGMSKGSIKEIVARRAKSGKVKVLDIGCGAGIFLKELKAHFGQSIEAHGVVLARPLSEKAIERLSVKIRAESGKLPQKDAAWLDMLREERRSFEKRINEGGLNVHVGLAETHSYGKKFDLIFSVHSLTYAVAPMRALINSLNHLRLGGEAFIHFGINDPLKKKETILFLQQRGFAVEKLGRGAYHFTKKTNKEIDLKGLN